MRGSLAILLLGLCLSLAIQVQAQTGAAKQKNEVLRLTRLYDSSAITQYRHTFTYDAQGRPATHKWDYLKQGKLMSSNTMRYQYNEVGRLVSKISDQTKYLCFYDSLGTLVRINQEMIHKGKWVLAEETLLEEKPWGNGKQVHFIMNKSTPLPSGKMSALEKYADIEYTLDKSNNIQRSKTLVYNYKALEQPVFYEFYFDSKPNPVQNLIAERWYQFDLENGGLTNVTRKRVAGRITEDRVYTYNEMGYPVRCDINEKRIKTYAYEMVEVPVQEEPLEMIAATGHDQAVSEASPLRGKPGPEMVKPFVLLYPNPASVNFTVKANHLGKGAAVLRVYSAANLRVITEVHYEVEDQLEALITTNGMAAGLYVVELTSPTGKLQQRLVVR